MDLVTERLVLRPMVQQDAGALFAILGDPEAMRFWHRPAIQRLDVAEEMVREQIAANALCRYWTVWRMDDAIGSCDLSLIDPAAGRAETGFLFRRDQWGKGYAGEAMAALTGFALGDFGLNLLIAKTHLDNAPARHVLERLGFSLGRIVSGYAPAPGIAMDCAVYALRRQASNAQKGR
jgi:[ribosomal protein S5]-alanine N-acetyltransferase